MNIYNLEVGQGIKKPKLFVGVWAIYSRRQNVPLVCLLFQ